MARPVQYERLIIGYHGCDDAVARRVLLRGDALRPSDNKYDWLGKGIYFWEHGPERAQEWADEMAARGKIRRPTVLGAFIHLGRCFDLTDTSATTRLLPWYEEAKQTFQDLGKALPENAPSTGDDHDLLLRRLDCLVLNLGLGYLDQTVGTPHYYQTVRGVFPEGRPAFPGSRILMKTHVQIAVRDPQCIVGYFRPAP
jgi:hypothetical protein